MARHIMNSFSGEKPLLTHSPTEECCAVTFPGYDGTVAKLPLDTVDAVLTDRGLLFYKDSKNEIRALPVPNAEEIVRAIHGVKPRAGSELTFENIPVNCLPVNCIAADKLVSSKLKSSSFRDAETEAYAELRSIVQHMAADLIRQRLDPLTAKIQEMKEQNRLLAAKIEQMEKRRQILGGHVIAARHESGTPSDTVDSTSCDTTERIWSDQGGIINGIFPEEGNPFCGRLRRR